MTLSLTWPLAPAGRGPTPPPAAAARGTMPFGAVQSTVPSGLAPRATTQECQR